MPNEATKFTGAQLDTLIAIVERGPLDSGDIPSKMGRDDLVVMGLAARVMAQGREGYTAATYAGGLAYKEYFGGETIEEAKANRKARSTIRRAQRP